MTPILGLDPGPKHTGVVEYNHRAGLPVGYTAVLDNAAVLNLLNVYATRNGPIWVACERMAPQGRVGYEILDTVVWSGRYQQRAEDVGLGFAFLYRQGSVCRNLLGTHKGNDTLIRAALIRRLGDVCLRDTSGKRTASHAWAALAVAVTFADLKGW